MRDKHLIFSPDLKVTFLILFFLISTAIASDWIIETEEDFIFFKILLSYSLLSTCALGDQTARPLLLFKVLN